MLDVEEARRRLLDALTPLAAAETVPLFEALNRILAHDLQAPFNVPPYDNAAMDGYALRSDDLPDSGTRRLEVIATVPAGKPYPGTVESGQCARIMTGGALPRGCDTVVAQEQVQREEGFVVIGHGHRRSQFVRRAGEDLAAGRTAIAAGKRLTPADLGLAASLGVAQFRVARRPRVAFFSTGDELLRPDEPPAAGKLYDSNRPVLHGLLINSGVTPKDLGIVPDRREALLEALLAAAADADAVITTGGASVGDADFVRDILGQSGELHFWRVGIKPGRPFTFGRIGGAWFFGLPGNPVSAMVTYYQFVQPALRRLMNQRPRTPPRFKVRCVTPIGKAPGRTEFQRGVMERDGGVTVVRALSGQGSHILRSMSEADCFIVLPADCGDLPAGSLVDVEPFSEL
jgi:molybdopterin molybdotransferase